MEKNINIIVSFSGYHISGPKQPGPVDGFRGNNAPARVSPFQHFIIICEGYIYGEILLLLEILHKSNEGGVLSNHAQWELERESRVVKGNAIVMVPRMSALVAVFR